MPVGIHTITLAPGVSPEEFERFMAEELLPAARTVVDIRMGMHPVDHTLVRGEADGEAGPVYLWITEVGDQDFAEAIERFPKHVGAALKARLEAFGSQSYARFGVVARASEGRITTPTGGPESEDPDGWVGA